MPLPAIRPRWFAATLLLIAAQGLLPGCSPNEMGTIDLKKKAETAPSGGSMPREFRKGDLEVR